MRLMITGSPGTGKTTVARALSEILNCKYINEKKFSLEKGIATWNAEYDELEIPLKKLEKLLNEELAKSPRIIVEGHLLCETRLNVDLVILLRVDPEILQERLERKGYDDIKVADNVFCEGIEYCKKHVFRRYPKEKILEVKNESKVHETIEHIIKHLKERGLI